MKNMNKGYLWTCKYYFKYWEEKGETKGEMYGKGGRHGRGVLRRLGAQEGMEGQLRHSYTWGCMCGSSPARKAGYHCSSREEQEGHHGRWFIYTISLDLPSN